MNQESLPKIDVLDCSECRTCLEWMQIVMDEEASSEQIAFVKNHVDNCKHCQQCYEVDTTLKELIRCKCGKEIPQELLDHIQLKLSEMVV
jgi:mycothiol system anti-sigma-R factor